MKPLTVAFLYNTRHFYPDPADPSSQVEADFDDPKTIDLMCQYLKDCGYALIPIEADENAYLHLHRQRNAIDIAFNYSMGIRGLARYAHLPSMLEMLNIPYTGSDPTTQAVIMNKARMQEILAAHNVSVLPSQVFRTAKDRLSDELEFPLIVKPIAQGSSAGITGKSVVENLNDLTERVENTISTFGEPALVQPFLDGREFSVPMLGNPPVIFPIIEPEFSRLPEGYAPMDSLEVKWVFEEQTDSHHLSCPAKLDPFLEQSIKKTVLDSWEALGMRDLCRIDVRCDRKGKPYVLDVNSPPGLLPPEITKTSYFPMSARAAGLSYTDLLKMIFDTALSRINSKH